MLVLDIVIFLLVVAVGYFIWKDRTWINMCMEIHREPWNLPGFGCANLCLQGEEERMGMFQRFGRIANKQDGMTGLWLGLRYFIVLTDANVNEIVYKTLFDKGEALDIIHEFLGNGSIFAPVKIWRPRRKVLAPTFSTKKLNHFTGVFDRQSSVMVEQLKGAAGKGTFSVQKYLAAYTMDSVCETTLGLEMNAQLQPEQPFLKAFYKHCEMCAARIIQPLLFQKIQKYLPSYENYMKPVHYMWEFVDNIIKLKHNKLAEKKKFLEFDANDTEEQTPFKPFLEELIESSGGALRFTNMELREECLVLVLAGTDTSAMGAAFTCMMMAYHSDVQQKVYEEVMQAVGESDRPITSSDLPKLKYLEAVIKESLRLYPPVPIVSRKVDQDLQLPSGKTLVKGTNLLINIWGTHRNPQYWGEDAEEFRPDRLIGSTLHPAAYIPFSTGPRACLGYQYAMMSTKVALANLVRHYRILPASNVRDIKTPLRVKFDIFLKHVENFELQIEERK